MKFFFPALSLILLFIACGREYEKGIYPCGLRCDYSENPVGIDNKHPELSWFLTSGERNQSQSAYRILVSCDPGRLNKDEGEQWDSREVISDHTAHVVYRGIPLEPCKRYYWKVCVWDKKNKKSSWSSPAFWETGLMEPSGWKARWIGNGSVAGPLFRKEFDIDKPLSEARVYISGLGYYELRFNGTRIGDHVLDPAQSDYEQRVFYVAYDVTGVLKPGTNVAGVMSGNGWYHQTAVNTLRYGWGNSVYGTPRFILQMHLRFSDGTDTLVVSDETWKSFPGPVVSDNIYAGEEYDARLEQKGWDSPGFNAANWRNATSVESPGGRLAFQNMPPIKKMQIIHPVNITHPKPGVFVFDMGQNFSGWTRIKLKAVKGTRIQLRFAEEVFKDGMIDPRSTGCYATGVVQTDSYICKGDDMETWEPRFTYHGFRYAEMTGFPGIPSKENLEGVVVHTSLKETGSFNCSDGRINQLHRMALWTEKSNLHGVPTDCPHRERCGWLGDAFLTSDMTLYNFDAASFWRKFLLDIETTRRGEVPANVAPGRRTGGISPDWGAAFVQLVWNLYLYCGDMAVIDAHYDGLSFFMDHLQKIARDHLILQGIGSLFPPGRITSADTPVKFTSTLLYHFCAEAMACMSQASGRDHDAVKYKSLAEQIKNSFNHTFYDISAKTYGGQEKNTLALAFSLVPEEDETKVAENLNKDVLEIHNGHIATGIFGTRYLYWVLGNYGYHETIRRMLNHNAFPGHGYLISRGATTFWENWGELSFTDREGVAGDERSKNHPFQGGFDAWFFNGLAGINPDPENPGFKHIIFKPQLLLDQGFAEASCHSIRGLISANWETSPDTYQYQISVPVNTTATVYLPADSPDSVIERAPPAGHSKKAEFSGIEKGYVVFKTGSGDYSFSVKRDH